MPPSSTLNHVSGSSPVEVRFRQNSKKILPAIPFALSKPVSARPASQAQRNAASKTSDGTDTTTAADIRHSFKRLSVAAADSAEPRGDRSSGRTRHEEARGSSDALQSNGAAKAGAESYNLGTASSAIVDQTLKQQISSTAPDSDSPVEFRNGARHHRPNGSVITFGQNETIPAGPDDSRAFSKAAVTATADGHMHSRNASESTHADDTDLNGFTNDLQPTFLPPHTPRPNPPGKLRIDPTSNFSPPQFDNHTSLLGDTPRRSHGRKYHDRNISQVSSTNFSLVDGLRSPHNAFGFNGVPHYDPRMFSPPPITPHNHQGMQSVFPNPWAPELENTAALRDHILSNFGGAKFADCRIHILDETSGLSHQFDGHGLIFSRSHALAQRMRPSSGSNGFDGRFEADVLLNDRYLRIGNFLDAVRFLYGAPLPTVESLRPNLPSSDEKSFNESRVQSAMQHIAMGQWLGIVPVAARGVDLAASVLQWDTIQTVLSFVSHGSPPNGTSSNGEAANEAMSSSSSEDLLGRSEVYGNGLYEPFASELLQRVIRFIVQTLPHDFYLDSSAVAFNAFPTPTSPVTDESRNSRVDPRLSKIRFGDAPADAVQRPSSVNTTVSSVLLSLPFSLLQHVLEHDDLTARLGPDTVSSVMRQVIAEREFRRNKAVKALESGRTGFGLEVQQWTEWRELVEPSRMHRAGSHLVRRRREIDTPVSSGAQSEWSK